MDMTKQFKQIVKKIYTAGFFYNLRIEQNRLTFTNVNKVLFCFDLTPCSEIANLGIFHAGYVKQWQELAPTYESEFNSLGMVDRAKYSPFFIQETDNPDFILRAALSITLN